MPDASIDRGGHICDEEMLEVGDTAVVSRREERPEKALVRSWANRATLLGHHALSGSTHELPAIRGTELKEVRDPVVGIVERFSQHVRGALGRRQLGEHQQHGDFDRLSPLGIRFGTGARF
jgi:hypothetical protein